MVKNCKESKTTLGFLLQKGILC